MYKTIKISLNNSTDTRDLQLIGLHGGPGLSHRYMEDFLQLFDQDYDVSMVRYPNCAVSKEIPLPSEKLI